MSAVLDAVDEIALETGFSGVVRVDRGDTTEMAEAYGFANRGLHIPTTVDMQHAIASGGKGMTALMVMSLVEDGALGLDTTARSLLGSDLPMIDDRVTVEHLLGHRSGIGDYIDEDNDDGEITDYVMVRPVQDFDTTEAFLPVLDGYPTKFAPDETFSYSNGGYVVLALLAERASGTSFHELVMQRVCAPAGLLDTEYLRSDELTGRVAVGYPWNDESDRTNIFHLPVLGNGDGGIYTTVADVHAFWAALFDGRIVPTDRVAEMVRPRSDYPEGNKRYGLGFWVHRSRDDVAMLEGFDAGVSFRSLHDPAAQLTHTVIGNSSDGAWPISRTLNELLGY